MVMNRRDRELLQAFAAGIVGTSKQKSVTKLVQLLHTFRESIDSTTPAEELQRAVDVLTAIFETAAAFDIGADELLSAEPAGSVNVLRELCVSVLENDRERAKQVLLKTIEFLRDTCVDDDLFSVALPARIEASKTLERMA